jgi:hypothetical protein
LEMEANLVKQQLADVKKQLASKNLLHQSGLDDKSENTLDDISSRDAESKQRIAEEQRLHKQELEENERQQKEKLAEAATKEQQREQQDKAERKRTNDLSVGRAAWTIGNKISITSRASTQLFVLHRGNAAVLSGVSNDQDRRDSTYVIERGVMEHDSRVSLYISLRADNYPDLYLRNNQGMLRLMPKEGSESWKADASFMVTPTGTDGYFYLQSGENSELFLTNDGNQLRFRLEKQITNKNLLAFRPQVPNFNLAVEQQAKAEDRAKTEEKERQLKETQEKNAVEQRNKRCTYVRVDSGGYPNHPWQLLAQNGRIGTAHWNQGTGGNHRGFNIFALDPTSDGGYTMRHGFPQAHDTYASGGASNNLAAQLDALPNGTLILIACYDDCANSQTGNLYNSLNRLGLIRATSHSGWLGFRHSYAAILIKGRGVLRESAPRSYSHVAIDYRLNC